MFSNGIFLAYVDNKRSQIKEFKKFQNDNTKERQKFETKNEEKRTKRIKICVFSNELSEKKKFSHEFKRIIYCACG